MITFSEVMEEASSHLTEQEDAVEVFWNNQPDYWQTVTTEEFWDAFEESFNGIFESEEEFGGQLADELGYTDTKSNPGAFYFDYDSFTNDLFMGDYWSERVPGGVAVFRAY
jgi:antirestriction protein